MFDHEGHTVVSAMRALPSGVFLHLDTTSTMEVEQRVAYTQQILREAELKKYKAFLKACKQSENDIAGEKWNLRYLKELSIEDLWTWDNSEEYDDDVDAYLVMNKCVDFEKQICFQLANCMCRKHHSVFQDHTKYIRSVTVKPFRFGILRYTQRVQEGHHLAKYLPLLLMKGESFYEAICKVRDKEFSVHYIRVDIKNKLPSSIQYELQDNQ